MRLPFYRQWFVIWRCPLWQVWLYTQALILYCPCFCCHSFCLWHKCSMLSFWVEANLCSFFYVYYVYMYCRWRSSYPEGCNPINQFNPTIFLCLSKHRKWISNIMCCGLFILCSVSEGERWYWWYYLPLLFKLSFPNRKFQFKLRITQMIFFLISANKKL